MTFFLSVTNIMMNSGMTGSAQGHQILSCVCTTLGNWFDMMNFLRRNKPAFLLALFTEWMLYDVSVTDSFPGAAVLLVDVRGTLVFVVLFPCHSRMLLTVLGVR